MDKVFDWSAPIIGATSRMLQTFLEYVPHLLGAIAILIIGWIVARIARAVTIRIAKSFDRLTSMIGFSRFFSTVRLNDAAVTILGNVVFWLIILIFLTSATNLLGMTMFSGWLDRVIGHLPNILSGALIIVAGLIVGKLVNDTVQTAARNMPPRQRALLARSAQVFTVATMIVIGVDQIGIDITVLITVFAIATGALLGGIAIAFSLGARTLVSNLIGARYLNRDYRVGETIRVGSAEGTILELSPVAVIIETVDGRMTIPAKTFAEEASLLLQRNQPNV